MGNFVEFGKTDSFEEISYLAKQEDFSKRSMRELLLNQRFTRIVVGLYNVLHDVDGFMDAEVFMKYHPLLEDAVEKIKKHYGYKHIQFQSLVLVKLEANKIIDTHIDSGGIYDIAHRIHIPITTNEDCKFIVGGESRHFKEGEVFELNNMVEHSVVNGDSDRIHLVFDIIGLRETYNENLLDTKVPDDFYL